MNSFPYHKAGFLRGLRWLPAAAERLFSAFAPMAGLAALWMLISLLAVVPLIGQLLLMLITPSLTAGAMAAFSEVEAGRRPAPTALVSAWRHPNLRNRLLGIGSFFLVGSLIALVLLAAWLGGQATPEQIQAAQTSPEAMAELLNAISFGPVLLLAGVAMAIVLSAMYFAIPLVAFADAPVGQALWSSLRAVLANWAAFLGLGLALIALVFGLGLVFGLLTLSLGLALGGAGQMIGQVLFMLMAMLVQVLMAGTQWVAFREIFGSDEERPEPPEDDQLLA